MPVADISARERFGSGVALTLLAQALVVFRRAQLGPDLGLVRRLAGFGVLVGVGFLGAAVEPPPTRRLGASEWDGLSTGTQPLALVEMAATAIVLSGVVSLLGAAVAGALARPHRAASDSFRHRARALPGMRDLSAIDTVGVVGAGTMGAGIAQVSAAAGYDVVMRDVEQDYVDDGFASIEDSLSRFVGKETLTEAEATEIQDRITGTTALADLADADLVVEAVVENMDVKTDVFGDLDDVTDDDVVLATNTSTLSITSIAAATDRPDLVVGLHFMNPVPVMTGVEVVTGEKTADAVTRLAHDFSEELGKETWQSDDKPGFVTNRILMPWLNEGIRAFDEGVATKADIDAGMKLGTNVPMGPLELADHIGLDVCLHASETLHEELGDRYQPAYLLKRKVAAGDLGKKTGQGFYEYD